MKPEKGKKRREEEVIVMARRQILHFLSEENLTKDLFLLCELQIGLSVSLKTVMKRLRKLTTDETLVLKAVENTEVEAFQQSDGEWRLRRDFSKQVRELVAQQPSEVERRTVEVKNNKGDLVEVFGAVGKIESATEDTVTYVDEAAAIKAVERLNDAANWRSGLRVTLKSGQTPAVARKIAGLPPIREKGKLAYLKVNKYGFIKPARAKTKDDNAFFLASELRDAKLKVGDLVEYTPELVIKDGESKKQARDVRRCDDPVPAPAPPNDDSPAPAEPPGERPTRLRTSVQNHVRERLAKGPEKGTIGFTRPRPSLSKLNAAAQDFVPGLVSPTASSSES